jgi:hypothetical protein
LAQKSPAIVRYALCHHGDQFPGRAGVLQRKPKGVGTLGVFVIADKRDESLVCRGSGKSVSATGYRLSNTTAHGNVRRHSV